MIVYNNTIKVEAAIATQWLRWFAETQAPAILATGCFSKYHVLQLIEIDESDGPTYAVQFYADTLAACETYRQNFENDFQQQAIARWGNSTVSFNTVMQQVV